MNAKHLTIDGKSVVRLAIGEGVVWKGLPTGYKYLDYIETTGTQYINTGVYPNQDTRVICEFMYRGGTEVYGCRATTSTRNFSLRATSSAWQVSYRNGYTSVTGSAPDTTSWHIADQNKNVFSLDGTVGATFDYTNFTCTLPFAIGAIYGASEMYCGNGRFKSCKIYDNGVLVRDLIPCKDADGNIGMYDTVSAVFYGNAGTGEFVAGAEI